jgi:hypothetical protein
MFANSTAWVLSNFSVFMLGLALLFSMVQWVIHKKVSTYEILFSWVSLLVLGGTGIYTFIMHAFMPETAAAAIGWQTSPFQYEVAMADLAIGMLGVFAFWSSYGFRVATVICAACILWGDAGGHIYQIIKVHNLSNGNAGTWLWMDVLLPVILICCLIKIKPRAYGD